MGNISPTQADGAPVLDLLALIAGGYKDLNCKGWFKDLSYKYPGLISGNVESNWLAAVWY